MSKIFIETSPGDVVTVDGVQVQSGGQSQNPPQPVYPDSTYPRTGALAIPPGSPNSVNLSGADVNASFLADASGKVYWQVTAVPGSRNTLSKAWIAETPDGGSAPVDGSYAEGDVHQTIGNTASGLAPGKTYYVRVVTEGSTSLAIGLSRQ